MLLKHHVPRQQQTFVADLHHGHSVVELTGCIATGSRTDPAMVALLASLNADASTDLTKPVKRFEKRRELSVEVAQELVRLGRADLLNDERVGASYRPYLGGRVTYHPSTGRVVLGECERETLASILLRLAEHVAPPIWRRDGMQALVTYESGLQVVNSLVLKGQGQIERLQTIMDPHEALEHHVWWIFERLLALRGENALLATIDGRWGHGAVPSLGQVLHQTVSGEADRSLLLGDLAVLQFKMARHAVLVPGATTPAELFAALETIGYMRLGDTVDVNVTQRAERLLKSIGTSFERVRVARIDWQPLLKGMTFSHAKR